MTLKLASCFFSRSSSCFLVIAALSCVAAVRASDYDTYIAPLGDVSVPTFPSENPFAGSSALKPDLRMGFRVEAGKLKDNISLDVRFGTRSYYTDFGAQLRMFDCFGYEATIKLCYGAGLGVMYSPGFITEPVGRNFVDLQVEPFIRLIFDSKSDVALIAEAATGITVSRSYSTPSPIEIDSRTKVSPKLAFGLLFDWEKVEDPLNLNFSGDTAALSSDYKTVLFGLRGGLALTKLYTSASGTVGENRSGAVGGISLDAGKGRWGFMLDALYANRLIGVDEVTSVNMERLEIVPQLRFHNVASTFFMASAGFFTGLPLQDVTTTTMSASGQVSKTGSATQEFDAGLVTGFGMGTRSKLVTITMEVRFSFGLVETSKGSGAYTRPLDFLIGFLF